MKSKAEVDALFEEWMQDAPSDASIKRSASLREVLSRPDVRERQLAGVRQAHKSQEMQEKRRASLRETLASPEVKLKRSQTSKEVGSRAGVVEKRRVAYIKTRQQDFFSRYPPDYYVRLQQALQHGRGEDRTWSRVAKKFGVDYGHLARLEKWGYNGQQELKPQD